MKHQRSSRHLYRMWHRGDKATIDHLVRAIASGKDDAAEPAVTPSHSAFTASGLAVEAQIRKAASPSPVGLAMF